MKAPRAAAGLLLALSALPARAQELAPVLVRLDSTGVFDALARAGFEVAGVQRLEGGVYAVVYASAERQAALAGRGLAVRAAAPRAPAAAVHFRDPAAVDATLAGLASTGRVTVDTVGRSWEDRPVVAVKIGTDGDDPARPNVLFLGAHHAREWISAEIALRLIEYLSGSPSEAALVAQRDVWVMPVVNPDGYRHSFDADRFWRKNRRRNADGTVGVDLNRNYPGFWGLDDLGSSPVGGAETYRGTGPASEPETQAVMAFHAAHPPDVALSYHSYSNLVLYPFSHRAGALPPDLDRFRRAAGTALTPVVHDRLAETARETYYPGPGWLLYPTNGDYTEWAYRTHGTVAYTVELTAGCCVTGQAYGFDFPDDSAAIGQVFADNLPLAIAALSVAGSAGGSPGAAWEAVWPEARLVTAPGAVPVATADGSAVALIADSTERGAHGWRWRGDVPRVRPGTRVTATGAPTVEVVTAGGLDLPDDWTGWVRDTAGSAVGTWHWRSTSDTLRSPRISLAGVSAPYLAFWTRHDGSLFLPEQYALVEASTDDGATWGPIARLEGSAPAWYPVTVPLPAVPQVRLRFVTTGMTVRIDAVHVFGAVTAPAVVVQEGELGLSENPVRSTRVFLTWQPTSGDARVSVFTFAGLPVFRTSVPAADARFGWDLTDLQGRPVETGAYAVVVEVGGAVLRRRLFVVRTP